MMACGPHLHGMIKLEEQGRLGFRATDNETAELRGEERTTT